LLIEFNPQISLLTLGWIKVIQKMTAPSPVRSVPVADDPSHRVRQEFKGNLVTKPSNGASSLYEMAAASFKSHANEVCMRKRVFLGWKDDKKKVKEFGPDLIELKYGQVGEQANKFGAALRGIAGCVASDSTTTLDKVKKPCRIAIFENTCAEWMISALGAFSQSIGVATVYATLGIDAVTEAIVDNSIPVIVCNKTSVKYLADKCKEMPCLKVIVYTSDLIAPDAKVDLPSSAPRGLKIYSFEEFVALGDVTKYPVTTPTPDTTAVIMYTSGSTGKPKGKFLGVRFETTIFNIVDDILTLPGSLQALSFLTKAFWQVALQLSMFLPCKLVTNTLPICLLLTLWN
jgi:long-subunit acyl-CoA synthetase (AMP-forming)